MRQILFKSAIDFVLATCYLTWDLPLRVFCKPNETLPKQTNFSFASGHPLEIASGAVWEPVFTSTLIVATPSWLRTLRVQCMLLQSLWALLSLAVPWFLPPLLRGSLGGGIWWTQPILDGIFQGLSLPAHCPAEGLCIYSHHVGGSFSNDDWARHWWI